MITIFIAEGDPSLQQILRGTLRTEGYAVVLAADGEDVLQAIRAYQPDLILLNCLLLNLEAHTVCNLVRKDHVLAHIPIIVLAHFSMQREIQTALDAGADAYLITQHPFPSGIMISLVAAVLRRSAGKFSPLTDKVVSVGNLRLDLVARTACVNRGELKLSHLEFDLLAELMIHKGVVLSRELLLSRVWGIDHPVDTRTVDVHVRWLREKIEPNPSKPERLITVRGIGYRFNDEGDANLSPLMETST